MGISSMNALAGVINAGDALKGVMNVSGNGSSLDYQGKIPADADVNLLDTLKQVGFSGQGLATAYAVAKAESGGRSNAYNPPSNNTGDDSFGLFQINMIGGLGPERLAKNWKSSDGSSFKLSGKEDLFDPLTNAKVAYHMSNGGKNWSAWTTYTSGKYQQFLDPKSTGGGTPGSPGISTASSMDGMSTTSVGVSSSSGGSNVVNFNVYLHDVSDAQAMIWAKKVETYLKDKNEISAVLALQRSMHGRSWIVDGGSTSDCVHSSEYCFNICSCDICSSSSTIGL
jgi:hypothetical protein